VRRGREEWFFADAPRRDFPVRYRTRSKSALACRGSCCARCPDGCRTGPWMCHRPRADAPCHSNRRE
jgi:hypothetical protein